MVQARLEAATSHLHGSAAGVGPMSRSAGRTRPNKLAPRQNIQIVREDQVDSLVDFDSGRGPIETGVEKAEEAVCYHSFLIVLSRISLSRDALVKVLGASSLTCA